MAPTKPADPQAAKAYRIRLAVMAVSGMLYTIAALWANQGLADTLMGERLIVEADAPAAVVALFFMAFTTVPLTVVAAWLMANATSRRLGGTWGLSWRWMLGIFGLWLASLVMGTIGLPIFLGYWAAFAWLVTPKVAPADKATSKVVFKPKVYPLPDDPKPQPSRRRHSRGGTVGTHGRIPKETEVLLKELVRQVTGTIVNGLPEDAPPAVRRATVRIILEAVLQTWWDDQRVDPLDTIDVDRLKSTILLATDLAGQRFDAEGQAIYRGVLRGLMGGWRLRRL